MNRKGFLCIAIAVTIIGGGLLLHPNNVVAQTLHTWSAGNVVAATDLNGNFTALKNGKVGSGVTLVNADVASNAAIAHSKMATPALFPKAWAYVGTACTAGTCTLGDSSQVTSITFNATGIYNVTLSYTPGNANFIANAESHTANVYCISNGLATAAPQFLIRCYTDTTGAATNAAFSVIVMDS